MFILLFLNKWLILFNSGSDCTNFIPTAELVLSTGTQTNEANAEIQTQPVTVETKISKCST